MKREEGLKVEAQGHASKIEGASVSITVSVSASSALISSVFSLATSSISSVPEQALQ